MVAEIIICCRCNARQGRLHLRQQRQHPRTLVVFNQGSPAKERRPDSVSSRHVCIFLYLTHILLNSSRSSSNGSPIDNIVSDTAAQLLFDKENHISQLVVQTGAKQCVDICNPEAAKSLNARDKLKVQSRIEVSADAMCRSHSPG